MLSKTITPKHKPRCLYGKGTEEISNLVMRLRRDGSTPSDEHGGSGIVNQVVGYSEPTEDHWAVYGMMVASPYNRAISVSNAPDPLERAVEVALGVWKHVVNPGYIGSSGADGAINRIDRPNSSATAFSAARQLSALKYSDRWEVALNVLGETIQDYQMPDRNYWQEAPGLAFEHGRGASTTPQSIDAIINIINSMGEHRLADRLEYLASEEILEEGDTPVSLPVCNGFLDFFTKLANNAYLNLTCANGWLCAEWDFRDDKAVIIWFMGLDEARVIVLDNEGHLVDINEGQQTRNRITIMENLERAEYFSWRNMQSSDVNLRPVTTSHATAPYRSGETTDDHPRLLS